MLQTRNSVAVSVSTFPFALLMPTFVTDALCPASSRRKARVRKSHRITPQSVEPLAIRLKSCKASYKNNKCVSQSVISPFTATTQCLVPY